MQHCHQHLMKTGLNSDMHYTSVLTAGERIKLV